MVLQILKSSHKCRRAVAWTDTNRFGNIAHHRKKMSVAEKEHSVQNVFKICVI